MIHASSALAVAAYLMCVWGEGYFYRSDDV
jgi:hypothetical protein